MLYKIGHNWVFLFLFVCVIKWASKVIFIYVDEKNLIWKILKKSVLLGKNCFPFHDEKIWPFLSHDTRHVQFIWVWETKWYNFNKKNKVLVNVVLLVLEKQNSPPSFVSKKRNRKMCTPCALWTLNTRALRAGKRGHYFTLYFITSLHSYWYMSV